jgi:hypothetical protein
MDEAQACTYARSQIDEYLTNADEAEEDVR